MDLFCNCCSRDYVARLSIEQRIMSLTSGFIRTECGYDAPKSLTNLCSTFLNKNIWINGYIRFEKQLLTSKELMAKRRKDEWNFGLFHCLDDIKSCLYVCFCPICAAGEICRKANLTQCDYGYEGECFCICCPCLYPCCITSRLQDQYEMSENDDDCMMNTLLCYCCGCCSMCRQLRHVRKHPIPKYRYQLKSLW